MSKEKIANTLWTHNITGKLYKVLLVTNEKATRDGWPITVVYQDEDLNIWSRPLEEWSNSMTIRNH